MKGTVFQPAAVAIRAGSQNRMEESVVLGAATCAVHERARRSRTKTSFLSCGVILFAFSSERTCMTSRRLYLQNPLRVRRCLTIARQRHSTGMIGTSATATTTRDFTAFSVIDRKVTSIMKVVEGCTALQPLLAQRIFAEQRKDMNQVQSLHRSGRRRALICLDDETGKGAEVSVVLVSCPRGT